MIYVINYFFKARHIIGFTYVFEPYCYAFCIGIVLKIVNDLQHIRVNEPGVGAVYDYLGAFWQIGEGNLYSGFI